MTDNPGSLPPGTRYARDTPRSTEPLTAEEMRSLIERHVPTRDALRMIAMLDASSPAPAVHSDGDVCTGTTCGNPEHGWSEAFEASSSAPAGLDEIVRQVETLPRWAVGRETVLLRSAVLQVLRAATRSAEPVE